MSQREFLVRLVERFEAARIPFMIVGSLGSTYHGEPRATNDIDIVIDPSLEQLDSFLASLGNDYYVSGQSMREAWSARSMFNVIALTRAGRRTSSSARIAPTASKSFDDEPLPGFWTSIF